MEPAGFGTVPLAVFVEAMTLDTLARTWDIGSRVGVPVRFESDLVEAVLGFALAGLSDPRARVGFADPVEPAPGADGQERLLAFPGRKAEPTYRRARLIAETTALRLALTIDESTPTPQRTLSSTVHSTYAAARASSPEDMACSW